MPIHSIKIKIIAGLYHNVLINLPRFLKDAEIDLESILFPPPKCTQKRTKKNTQYLAKDKKRVKIQNK